MILVQVSKTRRFAAQVLAALVLVAAGRFAYTSFERWSARGRGAPEGAPTPAPAPPSAAQAPAAAAGAGADAPVGDLIAVVLMVSHGDHRSEVFLDGTFLGNTAFVGDVSCRRGAQVTIRIQPKRGSAVEHLRRCDGAVIVVKEP